MKTSRSGLSWMIVSKHALRSDALWTSRLLYRAPFKQIPIRLDTWALLRSQYWERSMLDALQDARIAELLRAAARVPFWRERFAQAGVDLEGNLGRETLGRLPVTSKKDFFDRPVEEYTDLPGNPVHWFDRTSGSTGVPFRFPHDLHFELRRYALDERMFYTAGRGVRYPVISIRSRFRPRSDLQKVVLFPIQDFNSIAFRVPTLQKLIASFPDGVILHGIASIYVELARLAEEQYLKLHVRAVMPMGEGLTESQRTHIEEALGPVFTVYGTGETLGLVFECEAHRLHINEEWALLEIVDHAGKKLSAGQEGRVIGTDFDNLVMPFIRYDTGDLGTIDEEPCPCGRSLRTLRLIGRTTEIIELPDRSVSLKEFIGVFANHWQAARHYQIVQYGPVRFALNIVPGPTFERERATLERDIQRIVGAAVHLTWNVVREIPEGAGGKSTYFIRKT